MSSPIHIPTFEDLGLPERLREVGEHTGSFKRALREDPDIELVGEMRDLETVSMAIETAATGRRRGRRSRVAAPRRYYGIACAAAPRCNSHGARNATHEVFSASS